MLSPLISELSVVTVTGAVVTIALGGFLRGFLGFGAALLIVPVLSAILTPERALVIVFLIELPTVMYLMPGAFRTGDPKTVAPIVLAMFFTIPFGVYFLVSADPEVIKVVISLLVLAMVGLLASGWKPKNEIRMGTMLLAGSLSGLISGAAGVGGPPFVVREAALPTSRPCGYTRGRAWCQSVAPPRAIRLSRGQPLPHPRGPLTPGS